jgi:Ca2+/Na+ antiporter
VSGLPDSADEPEEPQEKTYVGRGFLLLAIIVGALGWLAYRLYPAHHHTPTNPNFIDSVFANHLVLFAGRLVLVAAAVVLAVTAVFVVISYWQRGKAGHWLTRFGPLETQAIEDLRGEVEMWQNSWVEQNQEVQALQEQVEQSDALIVDLYEQLQSVTGMEDEEKDA